MQNNFSGRNYLVQVKLLLEKSWPFLLALTTGIYFISLSYTGKNLEFIPGDLGDARFNNYILEHAHRVFKGDETSFWNAGFMYPEEDVITYSDNLIGSAPIYSFIRVLGNDRETSFQWWFLIVTILNFLTAYLFINWCVKNKYGSALGAFIFAFSLALIGQGAHAQTFPRFAVPLSLWATCLFANSLQPRHIFLAIFLIVYQIYCGIYLGLMLVIPVAILLFSILLFRRKEIFLLLKNKIWLFKVSGSVLINVIMLVPLMIPYLKRGKQVGFYPYEKIVGNIPSIRSWFFADSGTIFWDFLHTQQSKFDFWWDHLLFPGALTIVMFLAGFFMILYYKKSGKIGLPLYLCAFACIGTFILYTRIQGHSLYFFVYKIPGFGSIRAIQRVINIILIFYALFAAFAFSEILKKRQKISYVLFLIVLAFLISDNYKDPSTFNHYNADYGRSRVSTLSKKLEGIPKGSIISYEPDSIVTNPIDYQIDGMLAAQSMGLKSVNGYTATSPIGYSRYWQEMNESARLEWLNVKKAADLKVVVIK